MLENPLHPEPKHQSRARRAFLFAVGISNFDRFAITPILLLLSASFGVPLSEAAMAATGYFVAYGCGQLAWGVISDRFGRIFVIRIALAGVVLGSLLSVVAPSVLTLIVIRMMTGAFCGAIIPATITYIGDTVDVRNRQKSLADMLAIMAVGSALATGLAGLIAEYIDWRAVFLLTGILSALAFLCFRDAKDNLPAAPQASIFAPLMLVLRSPWAWLVMGFALIEGGLVIGLLALLPTAMEQQGLGSGAAGSVAALYGVAVLAVSRSVRHLAKTPLLPMGIGGFCLILAYALPAFFGGAVPLACMAALLGAAWALLHSSFQTWMTTTVPEARATAVAAMVTALFLGGGLGTALAGPLVEAHQLGMLFMRAAGISAVLVISAFMARSRYNVK